MSKQFARLMGLCGYIGVLLLIPQAASAAETIIQKIISPGPVFEPPEITIKSGDTVQWTVTTAKGVPHRLLPDSASDAFQETKQFDVDTKPPVTQTFNSAGVIHYHCFFHPDTMKGTITVTK